MSLAINKRLDRIGERYRAAIGSLVKTARSYPLSTVVAAVVLTAAAAYYAIYHFDINTSTTSILFRDLPYNRITQRIEKGFPQLGERIIVVIDGRTPGLAGRAADELYARLRQDTASFGDVYLPGGGPFFQRNGLLYLEPGQVRDITDKLIEAQPILAILSNDPSLLGLSDILTTAVKEVSKGGAQLSGLRKILLQVNNTVDAFNAGSFYQLPWSSLMGGEGESSQTPMGTKRRILIVTPNPASLSEQSVGAAIEAIRHAAADLHLTPARGVTVRLTGSVVLGHDQLQGISAGAKMSVALSLTLVLALLAAGLRRVGMVVATLAVLVMGLIWSTAFGILAVGSFNLISISFAVLFVGLGVDFGIQFCMRYHEELFQVRKVPQALDRTARGMAAALTLAALSAAVSFYSVMPTNYAGIVDLGIIAGSSMFIALFANFTVLPALLVLLKVGPKDGQRRYAAPFSLLPVSRHARPIVTVAAIAGLAAIPSLFYARFDFDLFRLQNPNREAVKTMQELRRDSELSPTPIDILEPNLGAAERVAERLRKLPEVGRVLTLDSYVPDDQDEKLGIIQDATLLVPPTTLQPSNAAPVHSPAELRMSLDSLQNALGRVAPGAEPGLVQASRQLQSSLRRFLDRFGRSPQALFDLQRRIIGPLPTELRNIALSLQPSPVTLQTLPDSLKRRYVDAEGQARVEVFSAFPLTDNENFRRFVQAVRRIEPNAAGTPVLFVEGGKAVVKAFRDASVYSVVMIGALLFIVLRRLMDMALILVPLLLAGLLTVGCMVLFGMTFNLSNVIVLPLLIGLGAAFGIYFVVRWRSGFTVAQVMRSRTSEGVLFSGLTTMTSFGTLGFAPEPGMAILGRTLALALALVLLSVLVVLPALLSLVTTSPDETGDPGP